MHRRLPLIAELGELADEAIDIYESDGIYLRNTEPESGVCLRDPSIAEIGEQLNRKRGFGMEFTVVDRVDYNLGVDCRQLEPAWVGVGS